MVAKLGRGIDWSFGFEQGGLWHGLTLSQGVSDANCATLASLGFRHVRIALDTDFLFDEANPSQLKPAGVVELDQILTTFARHNLVVVLYCGTPSAGAGQEIERMVSDAVFRQKIFDFVTALSSHCTIYSPDRLLYECGGEPEITTAQWAPMQVQMVQAWRNGGGNHTIVVNGGLGVTIDQATLDADLLALPLLSDNNVLYSTHFYAPISFCFGLTDQNNNPVALPYPSSPQRVAALVAMYQLSDPNLAAQIQQYGDENWGYSSLVDLVVQIANYQVSNHVRVYIGEYGAFNILNTAVFPPDALVWLNQVATLTNAYCMPHAFWYLETYSVLVPHNGDLANPAALTKADFDPAFLKAVGM
jgi:hypothetical protein